MCLQKYSKIQEFICFWSKEYSLAVLATKSNVCSSDKVMRREGDEAKGVIRQKYGNNSIITN